MDQRPSPGPSFGRVWHPPVVIILRAIGAEATRTRALRGCHGGHETLPVLRVRQPRHGRHVRRAETSGLTAPSGVNGWDRTAQDAKGPGA